MTNTDSTQLPGSAYADEAAAIRDAAEDIGPFLAWWAMHDDTRACPAERQAANNAMDAIDRALAGLHRLRDRLVSDIRASDDASAARVDAMLAARKRPDQRAAALAQRISRQSGDVR